MIGFIEGTVVHISEKHAIIAAGGIGYPITLLPKILISLPKNQDLVNPSPIGDRLRNSAPKGAGKSPLGEGSSVEKGPLVRLYVWSKMNTRDGTFDHYGFTKPQDLELFRTLTSVSGLGPKTAMQVMGTVEPQHLKEAVANEDPQALRKISGLGLKTAQRLVVELAGKLDYLATTDSDLGALDMQSQALEALMSLGYSQTQGKDALKDVKNAADLGDLVRKALQLLAR